MSRLKEYFAKLRVPKMEDISFGPVSVQVDKETFSELIRLGDVEDTERNLQLAEEKGCKPLSLSDITAQINPCYLESYMVLFDTPPGVCSTGNHWRVTLVDKRAGEATLQHCTALGSSDTSKIPPIAISLDTPLFTGLSLQNYMIEDLREILLQGGVLPRHHKNTIYWSGENGALATSEGQVIFRAGDPFFGFKL